jgi:hypothetical protein
MNRFVRYPTLNAAGLGIYSLFYGVLFLAFSDRIQSQAGLSAHPFWIAWDAFLQAGGHRYAAYILLALTVLAAVLLFVRRKPYDEYHTAILMQCLAVSLILTLAAIAALFIAVLTDPAGIVGKLTLFVSVNWTTVVLADLIYIFLCGKK